jgi:hypothetical protein
MGLQQIESCNKFGHNPLRVTLIVLRIIIQAITGRVIVNLRHCSLWVTTYSVSKKFGKPE